MKLEYIKTGNKKWKYKLLSDYTFNAGREFPFWDDIETDWYKISNCGLITIKKGYAWDGLTGFPDRDEWLRAALDHDALMQAIYDDKKLSKYFIPWAHKVMHRILLEDTSKFWANLIYTGLKLFHKPWNKFNTWRKRHV